MSEAVRGRRSAQVVGAGPAALVAAIALAQRGWTINLTAGPRRARRSARIDVLAGSALTTLRRLGIAREDLQTVAQPCPGTWSNWAGEFEGGADHVTSPFGHSWAVNRDRFEHLLRNRAADFGVTWDEQPGADERDHGWRLLAMGGISRRADKTAAAGYDDRLIALVGTGQLSADAGVIDKRLMIEAGVAGWAYGIAGPEGSFCYGVISDANSLKARPDLALRVLDGTKRIAACVERLSASPSLAATPLPCRWLPLQAGPRTIRIGDAQASFDPLAGRGLWQALRMAEDVAQALDADPAQLAAVERRSRADYDHYLAQRRDFYLAGFRRFGTEFWARRCGIESTGSAAPAPPAYRNQPELRRI